MEKQVGMGRNRKKNCRTVNESFQFHFEEMLNFRTVLSTTDQKVRNLILIWCFNTLNGVFSFALDLFPHLFGIRFLFLMAVSREHRDSIDFAEGICLCVCFIWKKKKSFCEENSSQSVAVMVVASCCFNLICVEHHSNICPIWFSYIDPIFHVNLIRTLELQDDEVCTIHSLKTPLTHSLWL